jgi:hypothetical protein
MDMRATASSQSTVHAVHIRAEPQSVSVGVCGQSSATEDYVIHARSRSPHGAVRWPVLGPWSWGDCDSNFHSSYLISDTSLLWSSHLANFGYPQT